MSTPSVSVVMAVNNGAARLKPTLDSILAQTLADFELVVVDDGSTDGTLPMLAVYARRDARIRLITQPHRGLTRALIAGCAEARAAHIARHDAGDFSDPRRLELQKNALDAAPGVVFVSCATQFVGPELEPLYVVHSSPLAREPLFILDAERPGTLIAAPTSHPSVMFRRSAYERAGGYRAEFYYGQDYDLWFRLAAQGEFLSLDEVLYTACVTPGSISGSARAEQRRLARLSRAALEARQRGESDAEIVAQAAAVRPRMARKSPWRRAGGLYFIGEALRRNRDARGRRYLRQAIAAWPFAPRAWVRYLQSLLL